MLRWVHCSVVLLLPACFKTVYQCGPGDACPNGLVCNATSGFCDPPGSGGDDAGVNPFCYGAAPFSFCFAAPPAGTISVSSRTTFDTVNGTVTGTPLTCATTTSDSTGYCVLAADTITIGAALRATGTKPLILLAANSIDVLATIDVGSHRISKDMDSVGAGGDPATDCKAGMLPTTANDSTPSSGGGAGGSFIGNGGNGGNGGSMNGGAGGVQGTAPGFGTVLRGGCPGQDGSGSNKGAGGHGGGAVFLIAGKSITVGVDGAIYAGGEGGAGATGMHYGGGGGGAGGLIGFDAMSITVTGTLIANGGGGGQGSSSGGTSGMDGSDASSEVPALGGDNHMASGHGGAGSAGAAGGAGAPAESGATGDGGGGGGGGAGLIKGPPASLGTNVSPAASP